MLGDQAFDKARAPNTGRELWAVTGILQKNHCSCKRTSGRDDTPGAASAYPKPTENKLQMEKDSKSPKVQKSQRLQDAGRVPRKRWVTTGIHQAQQWVLLRFLPSWWKGRQKTSPEGKLGGPGEKRQAGPPQGNHRVLTSLTVSYRFQQDCDKPKQEAPLWHWNRSQGRMTLEWHDLG